MPSAGEQAPAHRVDVTTHAPTAAPTVSSLQPTTLPTTTSTLAPSQAPLTDDVTCTDWGETPTCTCQGLSDTFGDTVGNRETGGEGLSAPTNAMKLWKEHKCMTHPSWCNSTSATAQPHYDAVPEPTPSVIPHIVWQTGPRSQYVSHTTLRSFALHYVQLAFLVVHLPPPPFCRQRQSCSVVIRFIVLYKWCLLQKCILCVTVT
jgi:hypothetical protein